MAHAEKIIKQANAEREEMQSLLRPVAEFFHGHEGTLFERYEALEELAKSEHIPSENTRLLGRVVGNLAADRVDPIQNVVKEGRKYIGIVEYGEHDYWYEYVEVDDVHGRVNVGVCAQCVSESNSDVSVAKGVGTTKELAARIESHYLDKHSVEPDTVETGATLVSGTTIAGNSAIHSGNDGVGSGLDAETYRGSKNILIEDEVYTETNVFGLGILSQFTSPSSFPQGIGLDSNDSIWHASLSASSIYQLDQSGATLSQFASPLRGRGNARGIGVDSNDSIWHADASVGSIYQLDQSGSILTQFASPSRLPKGIGLDSSDSIWHVDGFIAFDSIYQLDQSGSILTQLASPSSGPSGIDIDSNDSIWNADSDADSIYQLDQSGNALSQFASPSSIPTGIGIDSNDSIWNADVDANSIYQLEKEKRIKYE